MMELLFLKFSLPKLETSVPLIVSYFSECFIIVILTIVLSSVLGCLTHSTNLLLDFPPPQSVKMIMTSPLANILRVGLHASKVGLSGKALDDMETLDNRNTNFSHEWLLVAKVVDRISFIIILCIFLFTLFCYVAPMH
ncbi:hypothetical protein Avbf_12429 [Armadillidium vulgare]|nr:hypothetical protein Avbf_12429 [Armadillidium vulgare]